MKTTSFLARQIQSTGAGISRWCASTPVAGRVVRLCRITAPLFMITVYNGCTSPLLRDGARAGPFFVPVNHVAAHGLSGIRRVVMLPVSANGIAPRESLAALDRVLLTALLEQNRFEVVPLGRAQCKARFDTETLSSSDALPPTFLSRLQTEFAADAVLFIDLTTFSAYPPLALGFRAKLAPMEQSWLVWAFDEVFSAANPAVANSARRHLQDTQSIGVPPHQPAIPLHSPSRFASYAATAMFATLPPVRTSDMLELDVSAQIRNSEK